MRNIIALAVALLLLFGCPQQAAQQQANNTTAQINKAVAPLPNQTIETLPEEPPLPQDYESPVLTLKRRNGVADLGTLGGGSFVAVSYWEPSSPIAPDGKFATTVSSTGAYPVFIVDSANEVRATAISLPEEAGPLAIDAGSTAVERLWKYGAANQSHARNKRYLIEQLNCFYPLRNFIRDNMAYRNLGQIESMLGYDLLLVKCREELEAKDPI